MRRAAAGRAACAVAHGARECRVQRAERRVQCAQERQRRGEERRETSLQSAEPCSLLMVQQVAHDERDRFDLTLGDVLRAEMVVAGGGGVPEAEKDTHLDRVGRQLVEQREQLRRVQRSLPHQ